MWFLCEERDVVLGYIDVDFCFFKQKTAYELRISDWSSDVCSSDLAEIATLQPEVARYEPRLALDGGADGLDAYRALAQATIRVKASSGFAAFEIGEIGRAS